MAQGSLVECLSGIGKKELELFLSTYYVPCAQLCASGSVIGETSQSLPL